MITINPAKMLHVKNYGLTVGNEANMVVLDADGLLEAYTHQAEASYVIRRGRLVAQSSVQRKAM